MTAGAPQPQPSGCLRVGFVLEALCWLSLTLFGVLGMVFRITVHDGPAPFWVLGTMVGVGLVTALVLFGLAVHAVIRGCGLLTSKMEGGGTVLAIVLSVVRLLVIAPLVFVIIGGGFGLSA